LVFDGQLHSCILASSFVPPVATQCHSLWETPPLLLTDRNLGSCAVRVVQWYCRHGIWVCAWCTFKICFVVLTFVSVCTGQVATLHMPFHRRHPQWSVPCGVLLVLLLVCSPISIGCLHAALLLLFMFILLLCRCSVLCCGAVLFSAVLLRLGQAACLAPAVSKMKGTVCVTIGQVALGLRP
jgi:hypothetical protein